jgi:hypothetical protein
MVNKQKPLKQEISTPLGGSATFKVLMLLALPWGGFFCAYETKK